MALVANIHRTGITPTILNVTLLRVLVLQTLKFGHKFIDVQIGALQMARSIFCIAAIVDVIRIAEGE